MLHTWQFHESRQHYVAPCCPMNRSMCCPRLWIIGGWPFWPDSHILVGGPTKNRRILQRTPVLSNTHNIDLFHLTSFNHYKLTNPETKLFVMLKLIGPASCFTMDTPPASLLVELSIDFGLNDTIFSVLILVNIWIIGLENPLSKELTLIPSLYC